MSEAVQNRNYKDSVFVDLFSTDEKAKERFLSLYNALHGTLLTATAQLKNIRLDQVLYMTFYNDVSYLVDNKIIVLAEHQSTIKRKYALSKNVLPCTFFDCEFAYRKHRFCMEPPPSVAVLKYDF